MAEVQVKDDGAKKKGKPKKMEIHIDFLIIRLCTCYIRNY